MRDQHALDDRQHAIEFQKMLQAWRSLGMASSTSLHTLARNEPADDQTHQAKAILDALRTHGRPTARFVASQVGSSGSGAILWWIERQLADEFARDNESATKYDDIRQIVDNALLQVEAATANERHFMELAIAEARRSKTEDRGLHPKVGAVVVKDGNVIATAHRGQLALGDHAEFTVLEKKLKDETLAGATVYATLEPCTRRSPEKTPCAQRLIERRVKKVVIGVLDPNPVICGKGQRLLQKNGIEIKHFDHDLAMELEELNREWTKVQEAAVASSAPPPPEQPQERAAEPRSSAWHEKRVAALETIYNAFCDYLDFMRVALYVKHDRMSMDPMHTFHRIIERQVVYLDDWTAEKIQRYQGELLLFWNRAHESLAKEGEAARPKIQERLDTEIPAYLPRLRQDINEVVDLEAWRDERRRQAGAQLHTGGEYHRPTPDLTSDRATPALAPQRVTIREKSAAEIIVNLKGGTPAHLFFEKAKDLYVGRWTREPGWQAIVHRLPSKRSGGGWLCYFIEVGSGPLVAASTVQDLSALRLGDSVTVSGRISDVSPLGSVTLEDAIVLGDHVPLPQGRA